MSKRSDAQKRADATYESGRAALVPKIMSADTKERDKYMPIIDRLAKIHGSKKAAVLAGLELLDKEP